MAKPSKSARAAKAREIMAARATLDETVERFASRSPDDEGALADFVTKVAEHAAKADALEAQADDQALALADLAEQKRVIAGCLPGSFRVYERLLPVLHGEAFRSDPRNAENVQLLDLAGELMRQAEQGGRAAMLEAVQQLYGLAVRPAVLDELEREERSLRSEGETDTDASTILDHVLATWPRGQPRTRDAIMRRITAIAEEQGYESTLGKDGRSRWRKGEVTLRIGRRTCTATARALDEKLNKVSGA